MDFDRTIKAITTLGVPGAILFALIWYLFPPAIDLMRDLGKAAVSTSQEVPQLRMTLDKLNGSLERLGVNVQEQNVALYEHRRLSEPWIEGKPPRPPLRGDGALPPHGH